MITTYLSLAVGAICGFGGFFLATGRERNRLIGALAGLIGGLIGLGIYAFVTRKPKRVPAAQTELAPML
jgi:hypothetical protein